MKSVEEVERFEKILGQLRGLHEEIALLARKSPNDAVNVFKLGLINKVLAAANDVLGPAYTPFDDFAIFGTDDVPSNSDITLVLAQYLEEGERYRSDNIQLKTLRWYYVVNGETSGIQTSAPAKVLKK